MKLSYRNEKNARFISSYYNIPLENKDWFKVENSTDDESEILIFSFIGWPFNDSAEFVRAISSMKQKKILIRINSPGGDAFEANAMFNAIKDHPSKPITRIESLAASAASYIALAGKEKQAYKNTMIMIHEPMSGMWGNQHEFREVADILAQINENMVDMYVDNSNLGKKEIREMLKAETWMNAKTAKEKGFIDTIIEAGKPVKAEFDLSIFANVPSEFKVESHIEEPKELTEREVEKVLRSAGLSKSKARVLLARGWQSEPKEEIDIKNEDQGHEDIVRWDAGIVARITKNIEQLNGGYING
jgi:ATP-dependent Clp protease protease subunit